MRPTPEIIIGLVAPIGSNKKCFIEALEREFEKIDHEVIRIKITELLEKLPDSVSQIKSLELFSKMEMCTNYRLSKGTGYLVAKTVECIKKKRVDKQNKNRVYLIDQIKHTAEGSLLNKIYGENYIQISCFSRERVRDLKLRNDFLNDRQDIIENAITEAIKVFKEEFTSFEESAFKDSYNKIRNDSSHNLIKKDFTEFHNFR